MLLIVFSIISTNALASCFCSEPSEPSIPSGYYAEHYQMESAKSEVEYYLEELQSYKECLARCIDDANSKAEEIVYEWDSAVRQYNNR